MKIKQKNKLTVKQYSISEGVSTSAIYNRIRRKTLKSTVIDGLTYVYFNQDKSIKKPRK